MEDAPLEAPLGQEREQVLDYVEPGCRSRGEVEGKSGRAGEPFQDLRMIMRRVIIDDDVIELRVGIARGMAAVKSS